MFLRVFTAAGVDLLIDTRSTYVSLTNSPYLAHVLGTALDVYADEPYYPLEGGVVKGLVKVPTPRNRGDAEPYDYVLIVDVGEGVAVKMLHVEPSVRVGDRLRLGDYLGRYVTSGYMMPWSDHHMHVEVRPASDPLRVRGAYPLRPTPEFFREVSKLPCMGTCRCVVRRVGSQHVILEPVDEGYPCAYVEGYAGLLDAGIPHYGYGGVIISGELEGYAGASVRFLHEVVGRVTAVRGSVAVLTPTKAFSVSGVRVLGIGTYPLFRGVKAILDKETPPESFRGVVELGVNELLIT
ncbi:MAG: hypothetical protein B6U73_00400 [Desulfurococcales archaeon ex4484_204]|nr:MAG: hypothetical protein B6U73_00400 [Desulfurococcales archaeon ex4484_204]